MRTTFTLLKSEPLVKAVELTRQFRLGDHVFQALQGVSLQVERGAFLAISGPSGSGKSTLLSLLGAIDRPTSGEVFIEGIPIRFLNPNTLADFRAQKIGFIFQTFNLIPTLTALENVEYPLLLLGVSRRERLDRARATLSQVGLEKFIQHRPNQLSGGQRQRVAIARAIVKTPSYVLADEPTANLDKKTANEILDLMQNLNQNEKTTFVFSSHDPLVLSRTSSLLHLDEGKILEHRHVA